jgi:hypothetical protein
MGAAVDLLEAAHMEGEAHDHLAKGCPWYKKVADGEGALQMGEHCVPARGKSEPPRLVVKFTADDVDWVVLTPHTAEASTVPKPTRPPGGPGLFHIKGRELPPYIQHLWYHLKDKYGEHEAYGMAVGIVKKWAKGVNPGGYKTKSGKGKRTHADVQAAAAKNVAQWEKDKADAHKDGGKDKKVKATMALAAQNMGTATAPGAKPFAVAPATGGTYSQYGLHQQPSQTVSPSPPKPPDVPPVRGRDILEVLDQVPDSVDDNLSRTAKKFLEQAAQKQDKDATLETLAMLRSAQTALHAAHRADINQGALTSYTANVFTKIPPAEQSSANSSILQSRDKAEKWRRVEFQTAQLIDRIRKRFFHGTVNGVSPNMRLANMSSLDKVLALAGAAAPAAHDVSFPTESDTTAKTPYLEEKVSSVPSPSGKAAEELRDAPALDRVRIQTYISAANSCLNSNPAAASQFLAHAKSVSAELGFHHLTRHLHEYIQAVTLGGNKSKSEAEVGADLAKVKDSPDQPISGNTTLTSGLSATLALATAGSSAGTSAGTPGPGGVNTGTMHSTTPAPDQHQLHALHTEHLHHLAHLHGMHLKHLEHIHASEHASHTAHVTAVATAKADAAKRKK